MKTERTHPPLSPTTSKTPKFNLLKLKLHSPKCPSVDLKYALPPLTSGSMYQLPQRSLATRGSWKALATFDTNAPSAAMERRRLLMLRLLRLRSRRVDLIEVEAEGKRMSLSRRGGDMVGYELVWCCLLEEIVRLFMLAWREVFGGGRVRAWVNRQDYGVHIAIKLSDFTASLGYEHH